MIDYEPNTAPEQVPNDGINVAASPEQPPQIDQGQSQPQPVQPAWGGDSFDAQNFKLDFKGQTKFPNDAAHAKNLMQMGYGYSQGMEDLNKRNKDFDTREQELEAKFSKYADFDKRLTENPADYNKFNSYWNNQDNPGAAEAGGQSSYNSVYDQKFTEMEQKFQTLHDKEEDRVLKSNMDKLRAENPSYDWDTDNGDGNLEMRIMNHANNKGLDHNQLDLAFQNYFWAQTQAQAQTQGAAQVSGKVLTQTKAGIQQGPTATAAPNTGGAPIDHKSLSFDQLASMAKAKYSI